MCAINEMILLPFLKKNGLQSAMQLHKCYQYFELTVFHGELRSD
jgi:hypothetical protein